jgi:acyl-CoA synthetase (AMP-forming)/AMP-acid ligase II
VRPAVRDLSLNGQSSPLYVVFADIPKISSGKLQKFKLREAAKGV